MFAVRQMGGFLEELLMYFSSVCICVCVCSVICSLLSLFDGLIWVPLCRQQEFCSECLTLAPTAPLVIRTHLQQAYPTHTTAVKGVARSKQSLRGSYWFPHLRASLLLLITDHGTAKPHKALGYWSTAGAVGSVTGCLHCGWDVMLFV